VSRSLPGADDRRRGAWGAAVALLFALAATAVHAGGRIVLLLGDDREGFFGAAAEYYAAAWPDAELVRGVGSVAAAREILVQHAHNGAWRQIVLVGHGTEWTGLTAPLFAHGRGASLAAIEAAQAGGEFPPLPPEVADASTDIVLDSCGLGRRPDYLAAFAALLASDATAPPHVRATTNLVWFGAGQDAERRELPYVAHLLRGIADGRASQDAADAARAELAPSLPPRVGMHTLTLPVHIRVSADAEQLERYRRVEDYLAQMPSARSTFAGLPLERLRWRRRNTAAGAELIGDATLVLVMQSTPDSKEAVPPMIELASGN